MDEDPRGGDVSDYLSRAFELDLIVGGNVAGHLSRDHHVASVDRGLDPALFRHLNRASAIDRAVNIPIYNDFARSGERTVDLDLLGNHGLVVVPGGRGRGSGPARLPALIRFGFPELIIASKEAHM